ncbi:facilitated trehalose transporter Tret1-like [Ostrinia nubilalis]|uniref:facilitated trehalose transporter Tret1-like n=1 Tax=Ostrinia nubilalis TaxID=29057 RepID=UPI0030823CEF
MSGVIYQVLATLILDFNCLVYGAANSIPVLTMMLFTSQDTILDRQMTSTEGSLYISLANIGAIIGTPLAGYLVDYLGRKRSMIVCVLMPLISWALFVFSNKVEVLLASTFIVGMGGGMFVIISAYICEFSQDSIRGTLASGTMIFMILGILISIVLSEFLSYKTITYIGLTASTIGVALLSVLKESPTMLLKRGLDDEAAKAMAFYRNSKPDSKIVVQEIEKAKQALAPQIEENIPEEEKLTAEFGKKPEEKLSKWQFFNRLQKRRRFSIRPKIRCTKNSKSTQRGLFLVMTAMAAGIFQGMSVIQSYSIPLFSEAVPADVLSPIWCTAILTGLNLVSALVAGYLTDIAGRKLLMIFGSIMVGFFGLLLGTQVQFHWGPAWVTPVIICLYSIAYAFGGGTIPYLLMGEVFLPEVRGVMSIICLEWTWSCNFIAIFIFKPLVAAIGLGSVFYFFAFVAILSAVFAYFCQPETKGLSVNDIQLLLVKKKVR